MPSILISYRRDDTEAITGRIHDKLVLCYGDRDVFIDVEGRIPLGADFRARLREEILKRDVVLAVIGPNWLAQTTDGGVRLHEASDMLRIEIETALRTKRCTIPVLVGGAKMPAPDKLPKSLRKLCYCQCAVVGDGEDFHPHVKRLIRRLDEAVNASRPRPPPVGKQLYDAAKAYVLAPHRGRQGLIVAVVAALFLAGGAGTVHSFDPFGWRTRDPIPAVLLHPPTDISSATKDAMEAELNIQKNVFDTMLVKVTDAVPADQLGVLPRQRDDCQFDNLFAFGKKIERQVLFNHVARYAECERRDVNYVVEADIMVQQSRVIVSAALNTVDRITGKLNFIPRKNMGTAGAGTDRRVLTAITSYWLVRDLLIHHQQRNHPTAEAPNSKSVESQVVRDFLTEVRKMQLLLPPEGRSALQELDACQEFRCVDEFASTLADFVAAKSSSGDATASLLPTWRVQAGRDFESSIQ